MQVGEIIVLPAMPCYDRWLGAHGVVAHVNLQRGKLHVIRSIDNKIFVVNINEVATIKPPNYEGIPI